MCIAEVLIGILLLIGPIDFTSGIINTLGFILALNGLRHTIRYFKEDPEEAAAQGSLVKGLIFLIAGLFCAFKSEWFIATFPVLTVIYGVAALMTGISKVQWAIDMLRLKQKYRFFALIGAGLTLTFAILILCNPFSATAILWAFIRRLWEVVPFKEAHKAAPTADAQVQQKDADTNLPAGFPFDFS